MHDVFLGNVNCFINELNSAGKQRDVNIQKRPLAAKVNSVPSCRSLLFKVNHFNVLGLSSSNPPDQPIYERVCQFEFEFIALLVL